ncbi:hypothetical protein J3R82DRAFT_3506 [Butyriboletus roseoflavus]|nr:hypothetical protein J3R82DRAFT_3506 [Butyriboletus roseoflavus]
MSYKIDDDVMLATAHVYAALQLLPCIAGPRDVWMPWMHANLVAEVVSNSTSVFYEVDLSITSQKKIKATNLPHPKLLGSLQRVLARSYADGLAIEAFRFDEVRADDPSILGSEYVDVPEHALPHLDGAPFSWWNGLPPSVQLIFIQNTVPSDVESALSKDQAQVSHSWIKLKFMLPARSHNAAGRTNGPKSKVANRPSKAGNAGTARAGADPKGKGKRCAADEDLAPPPKKKKKSKKSKFIESETEDDIRAGHPSIQDASVEFEASEETEASKVCNACNSRGSTCVWPSHTEASQSQNERRACTACVLQKTHCNIEGKSGYALVLSSSLAEETPRGVFYSSSMRKSGCILTGRVTKLSEHIMDLERKLVVDEEEKERLVSRVANLDHQVSRLRLNPKP